MPGSDAAEPKGRPVGLHELLMCGIRLHEANEWHSAEMVYKMALSVRHQSPADRYPREIITALVHAYYGALLLDGRKTHDAALRHFRAALDMDYGCAPAHCGYAVAVSSMHPANDESGIKHFLKARRLDPDILNAYPWLGYACRFVHSRFQKRRVRLAFRCWHQEKQAAGRERKSAAERSRRKAAEEGTASQKAKAHDMLQQAMQHQDQKGRKKALKQALAFACEHLSPKSKVVKDAMRALSA